MEVIKIRNLSYVKNKTLILDNVSLNIDDRMFTTIIGPNGGGKTTLVKIILDLIKKTNGSVKTKEGLKFGYVPQRIHTNVYIPIKVNKFLLLKRKEIDKAYYKKILVETKIESLLNSFLSSLSGGEMQRVLLARALLSKPDLLILDEVAQNLDIKTHFEFYNLIHNIFKTSRIGILMISHDLHMIACCTQKIITLNKKIICEGDSKKVLQDPSFKELFGSSFVLDVDKIREGINV